jgi:hypothetical protein
LYNYVKEKKMKYFQNFKLSPLIAKAVILMGVAFLNGFSAEWLKTHEIQTAVQAGLQVLPAAFWAAIGLDQLTFNFFKQPEVKALVFQAQAMQAK